MDKSHTINQSEQSLPKFKHLGVICHYCREINENRVWGDQCIHCGAILEEPEYLREVPTVWINPGY